MTFTVSVSKQLDGEFAKMGVFWPQDVGVSSGCARNSIELDGWRWFIRGFSSKEGDGGEITVRMCRVLGDKGGKSSAGESIHKDPKTSDDALCLGKETTEAVNDSAETNGRGEPVIGG